MKQINKALDLFHLCISELEKKEDFKTAYLQHIKMYVQNIMLCEQMKKQMEDQPFLKEHYEELKAITDEVAKDCGYPGIEDLPKTPIII